MVKCTPRVFFLICQPLRVQAKQYPNSLTTIISTNINTLEFEYDCACTRKGVNLYFVTSAGNCCFRIVNVALTVSFKQISF